jgi:GH24 family phage-related lysozyme (muramidase)
MPINKITSSGRGKAAIAAALIAAAAGGWQSMKDTTPTTLPPEVILASDTLIFPWEGMVLTSHWDRFAKIWDICGGITRIDGNPVTAGMKFSKEECVGLTRKQIYHDYYVPLLKAVPAYPTFPVGVRAAMLSGAYNFGVGSIASKKGMAGSTATRLHMQGKFRAGCEAQTAFNKSGGIVVAGLVKRREMGDKQRIGEAELCVSGLEAGR